MESSYWARKLESGWSPLKFFISTPLDCKKPPFEYEHFIVDRIGYQFFDIMH